MPGPAERLRGVPEEEVRSAQHLVEVVETAPESLNPLQGFAHQPNGLDRRVARSARAAVIFVGDSET